ncbi:F0F1 ATP synthase subunit A [Pseudenhygromyxa sp. WMMC2535]|uniref:F0F1 ATP synthase subunit A n=1 Tax=Pseudenhygromyxa sp. WMMC2535 TaxID=2712867 RepID=UPI0015581E28|nr:F0F1 ATP synthase subunit A [Pseudenhygromyxa sp. WMMC2535]NVB38012.1 F0F1 ATP synthase subunit A [Pseudenhygromyxa sp. WMMC2535]
MPRAEMGDHDTLYTVLMPEFWARLTHRAAETPAIGQRHWEWALFQDTHYSLIHVAAAVITFVFLIIASLVWRASIQDKTEGVVPPRKWNLAAMLSNFVNATYNICSDVMGEKHTRTFLPFLGTLALFIFVCNIQGLIPGLLPATDTLKTNLALAVMVFLVYNFTGFFVQGRHYAAHFMGPSFSVGPLPKFPWLFPLMVPIEIVSHLARPLSLSLRLMGNMVADHKVLGAIMMLVPLVVPVPFLLLGVLVSIVQTLVFTLLTAIYLSMALEHAEEH